MIAERTFSPAFPGIYVSLDHYLSVRGHLLVNGFALHHLNRGFAQEPGKEHLVEILRQWRRCSVRKRRIAAKRHCEFHPLAQPLELGIMLRSNLVRVPVHPGSSIVIDLHPIDADVADPGSRIL